ncbi:hypothetical protein D3C83_334190 [compost metagenome]
MSTFSRRSDPSTAARIRSGRLVMPFTFPSSMFHPNFVAITTRLRYARNARPSSSSLWNGP